jgi:hypothetical protein
MDAINFSQRLARIAQYKLHKESTKASSELHRLLAHANLLGNIVEDLIRGESNPMSTPNNRTSAQDRTYFITEESTSDPNTHGDGYTESNSIEERSSTFHGSTTKVERIECYKFGRCSPVIPGCSDAGVQTREFSSGDSGRVYYTYGAYKPCLLDEIHANDCSKKMTNCQLLPIISQTISETTNEVEEFSEAEEVLALLDEGDSLGHTKWKLGPVRRMPPGIYFFNDGML